MIKKFLNLRGAVNREHAHATRKRCWSGCYPADQHAHTLRGRDEREEEEWEVMLAEMKVAILKNENQKARKLMYSLEFKIHEARIKSFNEGYHRGAAPLPF